MKNATTGCSASPAITMFPQPPSNTTGWFALLEKQFALLEKQFAIAKITDDDVKFVTLAKCLEGRYIQEIEGILANPPATGCYEKLKHTMIRTLADSDRVRVKKLVENEEMGDRKPSQFYRDLKSLASPSTPDDFLLSLWRARLPASIRQVLAAVDDSDLERLLRQADRIAEEFGQDGQRTARIAMVTNPPPQSPGTDGWLAVKDEINQLKTEIQALSLANRPRRRLGRRGRSREREGS
jgi:hypothetical protein